jgi:hypothetical protein
VIPSEAWRPFGINDREFDDAAAPSGPRILNVTMRRPKGSPKDEGTADPAASWLRSALIGLGVLAVAAAAVSFAAQYVLVYGAKGIPWVAALEAAIPDAGAVVFACLGIALALKGKRALRARGGNLACIGLSLTMNLLAARAGWRGIAIWVMPSAVYAFASDTLIGVIRAYVLAKLGKTDDDRTMLDVFGQVALYLLRFMLALPSTASGLRRQVLIMTPLPTASTAALSPAVPNVAALPAAPKTPGSAAISNTGPDPEAPGGVTRPAGPARPRGGSKRAQLIAAYEALAGIDARYGDRSKASQVARELAAEAGMQWGSARTALYRHLDGKASS